MFISLENSENSLRYIKIFNFLLQLILGRDHFFRFDVFFITLDNSQEAERQWKVHAFILKKIDHWDLDLMV